MSDCEGSAHAELRDATCAVDVSNTTDGPVLRVGWDSETAGTRRKESLGGRSPTSTPVDSEVEDAIIPDSERQPNVHLSESEPCGKVDAAAGPFEGLRFALAHHFPTPAHT